MNNTTTETATAKMYWKAAPVGHGRFRVVVAKDRSLLDLNIGREYDKAVVEGRLIGAHNVWKDNVEKAVEVLKARLETR